MAMLNNQRVLNAEFFVAEYGWIILLWWGDKGHGFITVQKKRFPKKDPQTPTLETKIPKNNPRFFAHLTSGTLTVCYWTWP